MVNKELRELYFNEHTAEWEEDTLESIEKIYGMWQGSEWSVRFRRGRKKQNGRKRKRILA